MIKKTGNQPIVVMITNSQHKEGTLLAAGAKKAAEKNNIQLIWLEPTNQENLEQQVSFLNQSINRQVDGVIISPLDKFLIKKPLKRADELQIPYLFFDTNLFTESKEHVPVVTSDDFSAGKLAADHMAKILHQKGKIIILRYSSLSTSTLKREEGFLEQIKNYTEMEVVNSEYYAGTVNSFAQEKAENLLRLFLRGNQLKIHGIFVSHGQTGVNMLNALKATNLNGKIRFITFGTEDELVSGVLSLNIDALVVPRKVYTGYAAVETIAKQIRGEEISSLFDTGSDLVTLKNYADPYTKAVLQPMEHLDVLFTKIVLEKSGADVVENTPVQAKTLK
ncbi:MAG: substrate-binding domain-containing protein [Planctomycetaceae bacterium]|nr:substrate-binding domain-containing protein [Planctomycetaceae bacterium]